MKLSSKCAVIALAVAVPALALAQGMGIFNFYSVLTNNEVIADQANSTGASFTTGLLHATSNGVNAQTGTSYTIVGMVNPTVGLPTTGDMGKLVTFSNTGAVAVTLPQAGTTGFEANKWFAVENDNSGPVTITPTVSTIAGASTLVLDQNRGGVIYSDGTNYQILAGGIGSLITPCTVPEGCTGAATFTSGGVLVGAGAGALTATLTPSGLTSLEATTVQVGLPGTAGTVVIYPTTASKGDTVLSASANSGATITNINTAAQGGARTYTVPDAGGNADFMLAGCASYSTTTGLCGLGLPMAAMKTVAGLQMTGSASSTNFGLVYTPGTGAYLVGTATSSGSTSNVAAIDFIVPQNYIPGSTLTIGISCYYLNGSSTASVHSMTAAAYLENTTSGAQTQLTVSSSGAVTCPITTATNQTLTITSTGVVPGSYLVLTLSAAVTNGGGASTEYLTGVTMN